MKKINWLIITPILVILFVVACMYLGVSYRVGENERAVVFNRLTGEVDKENIIGPGRGFKFRWNEVHIYDISETQLDEEFDVLDKDANSLRVKITVRFFPIHDKIGYLDEKFGKQYMDKFIIPETRFVVRKVSGRYSAEDIYSGKRDLLEREINKELGSIFQENTIQLNKVIVRSVELPDQLREELEKK